MSSNNGTRVFIGGLSPRAKDFDVERFFKGFNKIRDINLKHGYRFQEFDDAKGSDGVVYDMNNKSLCGGRSTVDCMSRELPGQETLTMTWEVTDTGTAAASVTGTGPNTVWLQGLRFIVENVSSRTGWQDFD